MEVYMALILKVAMVFPLVGIVWANNACQSQNINGQINIEQPAPSPHSNLSRNGNSLIQVQGDTLVKADGWKLPPLSEFAEKSTTVVGRSGPSKILQTEYLPVNEVIQVADGNTFTGAPRDEGAEPKSWDIRTLKVFSVDGEPFCYVMRGNLVTLNEIGRIEHRLATSVVLVYFDQDGDRGFESFRYNSSESPVIPRRLEGRTK